MAPSTLPAERLARLREFCLACPEATEKVAWGDPTWRVRDRIFAMQKGNFAGGRPSLWLKGAPGAQETLVGARPALFFVPPYVGHKGWIGIHLDGPALEWDVIGDLILESYRAIAGVRLAARLDMALEKEAPPVMKPAPRAAAAKRGKAAKTSANAKNSPRAAPAKRSPAAKPAKSTPPAKASKRVRASRPKTASRGRKRTQPAH